MRERKQGRRLFTAGLGHNRETWVCGIGLGPTGIGLGLEGVDGLCVPEGVGPQCQRACDQVSVTLPTAPTRPPESPCAGDEAPAVASVLW